MKYSIDTSAILDARKRYYPPDVFPQVWTRLDQAIDNTLIFATEVVLWELERKDDESYKWARQRDHMFVPINQDIQRCVKDILRNHGKLVDQRKTHLDADPFVIALALLEGCAVLTGEKPTRSSKRPNIPDVCDALGIRWLNMLQMFRDQGWILG